MASLTAFSMWPFLIMTMLTTALSVSALAAPEWKRGEIIASIPRDAPPIAAALRKSLLLKQFIADLPGLVIQPDRSYAGRKNAYFALR